MERADVVVIGAGIAGLVATLELLEFGRDVLLLDRCEPHELGGLAREAFGGTFMVDTPEQRRSGIKDSFDLAWQDWQTLAGFEEDDTRPKKIGRGPVAFRSGSAARSWSTRPSSAARASRTRSTSPGRTGRRSRASRRTTSGRN